MHVHACACAYMCMYIICVQKCVHIIIIMLQLLQCVYCPCMSNSCMYTQVCSECMHVPNSIGGQQMACNCNSMKIAAA